MSKAPYHLVHIVTSGEYKTPLVASQVFDRAEVEATAAGDNKPLSVSVWIIAPMREVFEENSKAVIEKLRKRCPNVRIKILGGIGRLNNWPLIPQLKASRKALKGNVVYHCRGESSFEIAIILKKNIPNDAIVLDVRGFWPMERLVDANVFEEEYMTAAQKEMFYKDIAKLKNAIDQSESVCTVSVPLRQMIVDYTNAPADMPIIPCCVLNTVADTHRDEVRRELNIADKTAILYLGGAQKHQYIEELAIPFMKAALSVSDKYVGVFITQDKDKMQSLLNKHQVPAERVRIISVPQEHVAKYLTGMDAGILLRPPGRFNNMSQPVKFGEYLSAGIPVILQDGPKNVAEILHTHQIGCVIDISEKDEATINSEVRNALQWIDQNKATARKNARTFVEQQYTWKANMPKEREMYATALADAASVRV